jgi:Zn-dependent protease with chaperone function
MRTLTLLICLILLLALIPLIIFTSAFHFGFHWSFALFYLVPAAIIYGLISAVGHSLNKRFNAAVEQFLSGASVDLVPGPGLLRVFGLLLFVLLPYLIFSLLLSVLLAITFGLYGFWATDLLPAVPIAVLLGLAFVVLGTGAAFFVGMYRLFFPPRARVLGVEVSPEEQPGIWTLARKVAAEVSTKAVDQIIVTPDPGVSVHLEGALLVTLFGRGYRVLQVGIPSVHGLTVEELRSILAHEYGHFSNRDTQWSTFTYAMGKGLMTAFRATPGPLTPRGWMDLVTALNPGYWTLFLFIRLFSNVTSAFSRVREVMADVRAMKLYGGEPFRNGLSKIAFNDATFSLIVQGGIVPALAREHKLVSDFSAVMARAKADLSSDQRQQIETILAREEPSSYDSHPTTTTRLRYSERFGFGSAGRDQSEVSSLFHEWDVLNEKVASLYNARYINYLRQVGELRPDQAPDPPALPAGEA